MAEIKRIARLIVQHLRANLSIEEAQELQAWIDESPANKQFIDERMKPELIADQLRMLWERDDKAIHRKLGLLPALPTQSRLSKKTWKTVVSWSTAAAAAVVASVFYLAAQGYSSCRQAALKPLFQFTPGNVQRPQLRLPGNRILFLDSSGVGNLGCLEKYAIVKLSPEHIAYLLRDTLTNNDTSKGVTSNTLVVPAGQTLQITMPDKSKATLNGASVLSFPVQLSGPAPEQRVVALNGEATLYIDHFPQSPFLLETQQGELTVLGTNFSVRDYSGEAKLQVSLFSGKLLVKNGRSKKTLYPGETATIDSISSGIKVDTGNKIPSHMPRTSDEAFHFAHKDLRAGMEEVAAQYRMSVVFRRDVDTATPGRLGGGLTARDLSLPDLLKTLQKSDLHFRIHGDTIIVSK